MRQRQPISVDILARPDSSPNTLFGLHDFFSSVGTGWETNVAGEPGDPLFTTRIVAANPDPFSCTGGVVVTPQAGVEDAVPAEIAIVASLATPAWAPPDHRDERELQWILGQHARGTVVASACTGAIVLAESGVLNGWEATSHWAYRDLFSTHYPEVRLRLEKNLCISGHDNQLVTCGGAMAWHELALHLVVRYCGVEHARRVARFWVLPEHEVDQSPYSALSPLSQHSDAVVRDCQLWAVHNYAEENPVTAMAEASGLARATFARRFRRATGYHPMEYVHMVRVDKAKELLQSTARAIDEIGHEIGYEDPVSFRRLFKRKTGLTPSAYRRKFGAQRFHRYQIAG